MIEIDGFPVVFIDTAGIRPTEDRIEAIGIQRTRAKASEADEIWYLYDAATGWSEEDRVNINSFDTGSRMMVIANKVDLAGATVGTPISALTRVGIEDLLDS